MTDNPIKIIGSIIGLFFVCIFGILIVSIITETFSAQQCQSYKDTISQDAIIMSGLNSTLQETTNLLAECNANYNKLVTENITKQDFIEIKGYYNLTQIQVNNLNQKFDQISTNYISIYNAIITKYTISIGINIGLFFEVLSFAWFKNELFVSLFTWIKKKRTKKNEQN